MSKSITAIRPVIVNVNDKTGLITEQQITLPTFMKVVDRKSVDVMVGLKAVLPEGIQTSDRVTFRMFHSGIDTAIAGIGGRVTFASFVQSLSALVTASAYGQNLTAHYDRLPPFSEYALKLAQGYVGKTESLSLAKLGEVMEKTITELMALPVAVTGKKSANGTAVVSTSTANLPKLADVPELSEKDIDRRNLSADIADKRASESLLNATANHAATLQDAQAKAAQEAQAKAQSEGANVFKLVAAMPDQNQAVEMLRQLAEQLGYRVSKMPAKKTA